MVISNDRRARSQAILVIDQRYSSAIWNGSRWGPRRNLKVNVFTGCHQSPEVPSALKKKWESRAFWGICAFIRSKAIVSWAVTSVHFIFTVLVFLSIASKRKKANSWGHGLPWVRMAMQHRSLGKKKKQNKSHNSSAKQTVITLMWLLNYLTARGLMLLTQQEAELHTLIKWLEYSYIPGYLVTMTFFFPPRSSFNRCTRFVWTAREETPGLQWKLRVNTRQEKRKVRAEQPHTGCYTFSSAVSLIT